MLTKNEIASAKVKNQKDRELRGNLKIQSSSNKSVEFTFQFLKKYTYAVKYDI